MDYAYSVQVFTYLRNQLLYNKPYVNRYVASNIQKQNILENKM